MIQSPPALAAFIAEVEALVAAKHEVHHLARAVEKRLPQLLADPDFLAPEYREPSPDSYRSHLLAVAPSRKFSVVSLVWLPGQRTPIHDHICWCVVGVLQGIEHEQRYGLREGTDGARWLIPLEAETLTPGHTCSLVPPEENIHQVCNAGQGVAISVHVYGDDLDIYRSSINQCFDDLPVRTDASSGTPVAWRRA